MNEESSHPQSPAGPPVYDNWMAALKDNPYLCIDEYPLLTDAYITGEITNGLGPYKFLNPVALPHAPGLVRAAIILRVEMHLQFQYSTTLKTESERYHGGIFTDEIAALSSLAMGIRLKAGGMSRRFEREGDPLGRPEGFYPTHISVVLTQNNGLVLPSTVGSHSLNYGHLELLNLLIRISPLDAIALVRAARLYQDALWIAESEPALAWLMLVSSIETAANYWCNVKATPLERLKDSKPDLVTYLDAQGIEGLSSTVAKCVAESLGSTKKFVDFIMRFLPAAPPARPAEWAQHPWEPEQMKKTMRIIYGYRSDALHGGCPFPAPMCLPARRYGDWQAPEEKPIGLGTAMKGASWRAEDTPMMLHTFEYIVRNALQNWWKSMAEQAAGPFTYS